jgi:protein TonB
MALRILTWLISLGAHAAFAVFMLIPAGGAALQQGAGKDVMVVERGIALEGFAKLGEDQVTVEEVQAPQMAAADPLRDDVKPVEDYQELPVEDQKEKVKPIEESEELPVEEQKEEVKPIEESEAVPVERPDEVKPVEEQAVIASAEGPDQVNVKEPDEIEEPKPDELAQPVQKKVEEIRPEEVVKEPEREVVKEVEREVVKEPKPKVVKPPPPKQIAAIPLESIAAQRESSGQEKKGGDTTAHTAYLGSLRNHLEKNKVNPRTEIVGTAVVHFSVDARGEITSRKIVKSSGHKALDDAALASVEKASPFPPIPSNLNRNKLEISVPFKFTVR